MGMSSPGITRGSQQIYFGVSSDNHVGYAKIRGALLYLTDTKAWEYFDSATETWLPWVGEPINLSFGGSVLSSTNPLPIKDGFYSSTPIIAFNAISATPATPYELVVEGVYKEVKMKITGTSTSRTVTFKAKASASDTAAPWMGVNFSDGTATIATQTTTKDEWWLFSSFDGLYSLQFNVTAVAGGNLTMLLECVY